MKKWEIIQEAKKHLAKNEKDERENNKTEFVCIAVGRVKQAKGKDIREIERLIAVLLRGKHTFLSWLLEYGGIPSEEFEEDQIEGYPKLQATRLAWMNWMQEYYKNLNQ